MKGLQEKRRSRLLFGDVKELAESLVMRTKIARFFRTDIWQIRSKDLPAFKAYCLRYLRIVTLALRNYVAHGCSGNATVLTYYSLLSLVPLFAVIFAIAKGFGLEKLVVRGILAMAQKANWQANVTKQILVFSKTLLAQAKGDLIAGIGVILLFWTVISILGKIEDSFNTIWEVKKPRTLLRKSTDYLTIMVFAPLLFAVSSSINVVVAGEIQAVVHNIKLLGVFGSFILLLLKLLPYFSMWFLLTALYLIMPNTRIPVTSGILAAVVAGTIFQIVQWFYIKFQIGVASQGAIYGSFAALPLFLGWMQISWMIVLFGAEIAHAGEHHETFGFHPDYSRIGRASKKLSMLRIFHLLVKSFVAGEKPPTARQIGHALQIPISFVKEILFELTEVGIVVEVTKRVGREASFRPGRAIEEVTIKDVLDAYEREEAAANAFAQSDEAEKLAVQMKLISDAVRKSPANVKLKDI